MTKTLVIVNSTGRQGASLARVASAVGFNVRAQVRSLEGLVAQELSMLPNVKLHVGELDDRAFIHDLFAGAHIAFVNTVSWGDQVSIGRSLADAALRAKIQHYIYSSMPDHSIYGRGWPGLPWWAGKFTVENYVRQIGIPSTFVYAGIYNNNFTSLPYPLFCLELQSDGSFVWQAPFHPDIPLPWLDAEHDVGPALLQIFKDGPRKWAGHRIALAFEMLTPREVCKAFARGIGRKVRYICGPTQVTVQIPAGYREQLQGIDLLFGKHKAPYFGPELNAPDEALSIWEGYRGIEEYAREVFPLEEQANGQTWMLEDNDGKWTGC
ncbi:NmrA-domain-containing protein [Xylona heveae TC161]|uniref:NmrA-domain-containing protein n=1 Tax=Xylona heveae (strain CBS 132557 / TC161) TaxID=1328760 RepID=A0A165A9U7_XYLHT|nr:NmrA-domain-containing protein [Xylona heveae TC161]KZF20144.1 NmrA-domain-containing protein [Xylona heveae TC161]